MKEENIKMTTAAFAKLHNLNKRTLHYYDDIGLFSPRYKGENNYRYYELSQSIQLENIRMLRELDMSIGDLTKYLEHPDYDKFIRIADEKMDEIRKEIKRLQQIQHILDQKKEQVLLCSRIKDREIRIEHCKGQYILATSFADADYDMESILLHLKQAWDIEQFKTGCGSYISMDKVRKREFDVYDGLFTPLQKKTGHPACILRPEGTYLCGYVKGEWEKIPEFYEEIMEYAKGNGIELTGDSYEMGMNEFAIADMGEYVTEIRIKVM